MRGRGRPRVPDEIHRLHGTYRADRHGDPATKPAAEKKAPKCPKDFNDEQRAVWRRLSAVLKPLGLLSVTYADVMTLFVRGYCRYLQAEKEVDERGIVLVSPKLTADGKPMTYTDEQGTIRHLEVRKTNPAQIEARLLRGQLCAMLSNMGLVPSALSKIKDDARSPSEKPLELVG